MTAMAPVTAVVMMAVDQAPVMVAVMMAADLAPVMAVVMMAVDLVPVMAVVMMAVDLAPVMVAVMERTPDAIPQQTQVAHLLQLLAKPATFNLHALVMLSSAPFCVSRKSSLVPMKSSVKSLKRKRTNSNQHWIVTLPVKNISP
jgi:hypothetical protein